MAQEATHQRHPTDGEGHAAELGYLAGPAAVVDADDSHDEILVATSPEELASSQHRLIAHMKAKVSAAEDEVLSARVLVAQCTEAGLSVNSAKNILRRATARVTFLSTSVAALEAGYCMMPDMPGDVVMVRSNRHWPHSDARMPRDWQSDIPNVPTQGLPVGEGRYVERRYSSTHEVVNSGKDAQGRPQTKVVYRAARLIDADGLPSKFLKPRIIERVSDACRRRIFDEIVCIGQNGVDRRSRRDPIVLGRVYDPQRKAVLAFLIAHFVDTSEL